MSQRTIAVAGATSGIGHELCKQLIEEGHSVISLSRSAEFTMPEVTHHTIDWSNETLPSNLLPDKLDGAVYLPGSILLKPFHRITAAEWELELQLNVMGAVRFLQAVYPSLKASGNASVVLMSTVAVQTGMPFHASVAAAKGAVEGLTRALAAEWAPVIRVNAVAPSLTDTPLASKLLASPEKREASAKRHPLQRTATAAEIAATVKFLLSNNASWITGQIIHHDGGISSLRLF
ncbi:MAG: SDR family oxidoreductase [Bacteroidia bacterium]|jgi:NAD(P)-dependent dehydrogenase (short-subunit alcohol dehydrogenase family)|nr:SDR family oxidoreductase [Bacteroidia bacterium]